MVDSWVNHVTATAEVTPITLYRDARKQVRLYLMTKYIITCYLADCILQYIDILVNYCKQFFPDCKNHCLSRDIIYPMSNGVGLQTDGDSVASISIESIHMYLLFVILVITRTKRTVREED